MMDNFEEQANLLNEQLAEFYESDRVREALDVCLALRDLVCDQLGADSPECAMAYGNLGALYFDLEEYAAAEENYRRALDLHRNGAEPDIAGVADNLDSLGTLFRRLGDFKQAAEYYRAALAAGAELGDEHPLIAAVTHNLGMLYYKNGDLAAAAPLFRRVLQIRQAILDEDDLDLAQSQANLATVLEEMGDIAGAEPLYRQALAIRRKALPDDEPLILVSLHTLARLNDDLTQYPAAESFYQEALAIAERDPGKSDPEYGTVLHDFANFYLRVGKYGAAAELGARALAIRKAVLGVDDPDYAATLSDLALAQQQAGNLTLAESLLDELLALQRAAGRRDEGYATALHNLGELYKNSGRYAAAELLYKEAKDIARELLGEESTGYATELSGLGRLYHVMGRYAEAAPLLRQTMAIDGRLLGTNHPDYAVDLEGLADLYRDQGNYAAAGPLFEQAHDILSAALGAESPQVASTLNNMARLYYELGNYVDAERLYRTALATLRQTLGPEHPQVAATLHNLALLKLETEKYDEAEGLYKQALAIEQAVWDENHSAVARTLSDLGALYFLQRDYDQAETAMQQASAILHRALGEAHPDYAVSLDNLGALYRRRREFGQAEALIQRALAILQAAAGPDHPDSIPALVNLALLYAGMDRAAEAWPLYLQVLALQDTVLGQAFSIGSERQRMAYLQTLQGDLDAFLSLLLQQAPDPTRAQTGFDQILRRKGLGAEAFAAQRDAVLGGRYPQLRPKFAALGDLRMQIAQATLAGPGAESQSAYRQRLALWNGQRERLEAELARQVPEMNLRQRLGAADCRAVAAALPRDAVLIEYLRFAPLNFQARPDRGESYWGAPRYLACVMPAGQSAQVQVLDLGEAAAIDALVGAFRATVAREAAAPAVGPRASYAPAPEAAATTARFGGPESSSDQGADLTAGLALRAALFDPLRAALHGRTRLLLAPDGELARLPFEALPVADGTALIDNYLISYLSVGRDVLRFAAAPAGTAAPPLVAAAPDYDLGSDQAAGETTVESGRLSRAMDRAGDYFQPLPGTKQEGEQIAALLGVTPLLDDAVVERAIKSSRAPRILHIATHGFFLLDQQRPDNAPDRGSGLAGRFAGIGLENPLLRSGLALAGANTFLRRGSLPLQAEDGILTAEDVSGLDLVGTELVTLSACDTGLGEVQAGEGVFGLRRAVMLAGAATLVMSLWKVADEPTATLMADFYRRLLAGRSRAEALREAQLALRRHHPQPYYWGAFICQGSPGPL